MFKKKAPELKRIDFEDEPEEEEVEEELPEMPTPKPKQVQKGESEEIKEPNATEVLDMLEGNSNRQIQLIRFLRQKYSL